MLRHRYFIFRTFLKKILPEVSLFSVLVLKGEVLVVMIVLSDKVVSEIIYL